MKKALLVLLLVCSCFALTATAQQKIQFLSGDFESDGAFDQWTEWKKGEFVNGTKVECRAKLSASKKGCKVTVETKNVSADKIKLLVVFTYDIPNVTTEMTGFEKVSVSLGEVETTTYVSSICGGKGNDYKACYSCGHVFKLFLK